MQTPWKNAVGCLPPSCLPSLLSYDTQNHQSEMAPLKDSWKNFPHLSSTKKMSHQLAQSQTNGHNFSVKVPSSQMCQVNTKQASTMTQSTTTTTTTKTAKH